MRERLKTATDAAALAACMQAKQIPDSINIVMVNGQLKMIVPKWDMDLSDPDVQEAAAAAAAKAFSQNVLGTKMPLSMVATPPVAGLSPATSSAALPFQAAVDWNDPQQTASGITYYNKYVVRAGMAVKTMFTAGPFASSLFNNGIVKGSNYGQGWGGAIPINAVGEAQAMSENN